LKGKKEAVMLLVLVIIAALVAAILLGQILSSRLFWIVVAALGVFYLIGQAHAAGDDADAILHGLPANMQDYAAKA